MRQSACVLILMNGRLFESCASLDEVSTKGDYPYFFARQQLPPAKKSTRETVVTP